MSSTASRLSGNRIPLCKSGQRDPALSGHPLFARPVVLKVGPLTQQPQPHRTCISSKFWGPDLDLLTAWGRTQLCGSQPSAGLQRNRPAWELEGQAFCTRYLARSSYILEGRHWSRLPIRKPRLSEARKFTQLWVEIFKKNLSESLWFFHLNQCFSNWS